MPKMFHLERCMKFKKSAIIWMVLWYIFKKLSRICMFMNLWNSIGVQLKVFLDFISFLPPASCAGFLATFSLSYSYDYVLTCRSTRKLRMQTWKRSGKISRVELIFYASRLTSVSLSWIIFFSIHFTIYLLFLIVNHAYTCRAMMIKDLS